MKNSTTVIQKSDCGRFRQVIIYERFQQFYCSDLIDWGSFGVLGWWWLMGDGHLQEVVTLGGLTVFTENFSYD